MINLFVNSLSLFRNCSCVQMYLYSICPLRIESTERRDRCTGDTTVLNFTIHDHGLWTSMDTNLTDFFYILNQKRIRVISHPTCVNLESVMFLRFKNARLLTITDIIPGIFFIFKGWQPPPPFPKKTLPKQIPNKYVYIIIGKLKLFVWSVI